MMPPGADHTDPFRLPPGPALSQAEQTYAWFSQPYAFLRTCAEQLGDSFTLQIAGWGPHVVFRTPHAIREICTAHFDDLGAGKNGPLLQLVLGDASLLTLDGQRHLEHRRLLVGPFHTQRMPAYGRLIQRIARTASATWVMGQPIPLQDGLLDISREVILQAVFGLADDHARLPLFRDRVAVLLRAMSTAAGWGDTDQGLAEVMAEVDHLLFEDIELRRAQPADGSDDILHWLLHGPDSARQPLSDREVRDHLITLIMAGHDTTATSMTWALLLLAEHPQEKARLVDELDALGTEPAPESLAQLPYLTAVCKEALRMRPVAPVMVREVQRPLEIAGVALHPGEYVVPSIYLAHHRPEVYPEPDRFRPDRFLEREFSPYEFLPFGCGARRCIGMALALYEMKIVLGTLLEQLDFENASQEPVYPVRRSIIIGPSEDGRMRVTRRR
jgi:cytochrome P450